MLRRATLFLLALAALVLWAGAPVAQTPLDYQRLFGGESAEEAAPEEPRQSRPVFDPDDVPSAEAYGALTGQPVETGALARAGRAVEAFQSRFAAILLEAPQALSELSVTLAAASKTGEPSYFLGVALFALVLIAVGRAVSNLFAAFIARPLFVGLQRPDPQGYRDKLPVLAYRVFLTAIGVALSLATAAAVGLFFHDGHEATLTTVLVIFAAYGAFLMIDTIWRMVLCPFLPAYRIPAIDTREARRFYRWLYGASGFGVLAIAFGYWVTALGLPRGVLVLFSLGLSALTVLLLLAMLRANAGTVQRIILDGRDRREVSWVTLLALVLWGPLAAVYLIGSWGRFAVDIVMGTADAPLGLVVPYLVVLGGTLVYAAANYAIERAFADDRRMAELNAAAEPEPAPPGEPGPGRFRLPRRRMTSFEDLARRVASLFAIGAGAYGLLYYWGGPGLFEETMALGIAEDVIDLAFVGYVLFHAIRIWIDRKIAEEGADAPSQTEPGEGEGGTGASRLATLLPLVRSFVLGLIVVSILLAIASEIGVNVAPLFAGAGILGLAIGFGSQTLVRDILSGAFFLIDDAFRRGEYIDVGEVKGTVEKILLRSFQLRHHLGMLHTIPFGEIKHLTNYSRDWVIMKLPLRLTYDTDVEKVRKLVKKLGQDLLEDPQIGDKFLQPLKSQGVIEMQDSAMIVRVKFMTKPGEQWVIRKRVFQEIRDLFEREGVNFAHREVTVRIPDLDGRPLASAEREAVGAATRTALDVIEGEQAMAGGPRGALDDR